MFFVFRILVGFMFFMHGASKLFGWFGGNAQAITSLMGIAGIVEIVVGILVFLGLFTQCTATIGAVYMLMVYFKAHAGNGFNPMANKGELALMYFAAFLVLIKEGAGIWSLDKKLRK